MDTNIPSAEMVTAVGLGPVPPKPERLQSVDLVRGLVMILMALDHVRDFWSDRLLMDPTDLDTTTAGIFLTRWMTHFCAPTFIFLAGTSAYLAGTRGKSKGGLSWFLFTRGLWLAFFEVTINRALWMFNYDLQHYGAGVFWAIGWAMVVLAVLVYLPTPVVTPTCPAATTSPSARATASSRGPASWRLATASAPFCGSRAFDGGGSCFCWVPSSPSSSSSCAPGTSMAIRDRGKRSRV